MGKHLPNLAVIPIITVYMDAQTYLAGLEDDQKKAVLSGARASRIIAAAGSGKTRTITAKIHRLLAEGALPQEIIAFTFTEKAAEELKQRIYERIEADETLPQATRDSVGQMRIGTIHGWCLQLLEESGRAANSTVLDQNQLFALTSRYGESEFGLSDGDPRVYAEAVAKFLRTVSLVYNEMLDVEKLRSSEHEKERDFMEAWDAYNARLEKGRILTFDILIQRATDSIRADTSLVAGIKHLIVDEYQDINHAQERLIRLISANGTITVVGDPRQCIYEWRGSDPGLLTQFFEKDAATFQL
jgi:DNA helicase-2/ATP-dependent DNA helicase PcrA